MQEIKGESLTLQTLNLSFKCQNNHDAVNFCFDPSCQNAGVMCSDINCKCIVGKHDDCSFLAIQRLVKNILNKKLTLSKQLEKAFQTIDQIYLQMIEKLSFDRQQLALMKENYGLSADEAKFLELIKNRELDQIKGSIVYKIKNKVKQTNDIKDLTEIKIKQHWEFRNKEFQKIAEKLKAVYTNKNYLKSQYFTWDKQAERQGFQLNGLIASKIGSHYNTNMAFLQPILSNEKKSFWGIKLNIVGGTTSMGICNASAYSLHRTNKYTTNYSTRSIIYQISSTGQTSQNGTSVSNCFTFGNNDIIYFLYDPYTSVLKISKNLQDGFYIIKNIDKSTNLSPYVTSLQIGDSAEIINQIPQIDWNRAQTVPVKSATTDAFGRNTYL